MLVTLKLSSCSLNSETGDADGSCLAVLKFSFGLLSVISEKRRHLQLMTKENVNMQQIGCPINLHFTVNLSSSADHFLTVNVPFKDIKQKLGFGFHQRIF